MFRFSRESHETPDLTKLWQPSKPDKELSKLVKKWEKNPTLSSESEVAQRLAEVSHTVVPDGEASSSNIRAANAVQYGIGNCVAHTEVTLGFAQEYDLSLLATWNGGHASAIWMGILDVWRINPYNSQANSFVEAYALPPHDPEVKKGLFMLDPIVRATGLIASTYIRNSPSQHMSHASSIDVTFIPDFTFSRNSYSNDYTILVMTPEQALAALQKPSTVAAA